MKRFLFLNLILFLVSSPLFAQPAVRLSEKGKSLQSVTVSAEAGDITKAAAATLVEYLKRISGAEFKAETGDGKSGIAVGTAADFPALGLQKEFDTSDPTKHEHYILRSHNNGVYLVGATEQAVEHAVWDLLYRLGYRQFFPGETWEIVPNAPSLSIAVDEREEPDYYLRSLWFTYGTWPDNKVRMADWIKKNRMGGLGINFGHAYGGIIARNKAEFDKHPEYFSERDGKRMVGPQGKFDISNPGLRQLVVNDALRHFENNPDSPSYSVDPSDGAVWGNSEAELALGSVSDRVTLLANEVAEAVSKKFPNKVIGFYAYNAHSPPPSIRVHPNVAVAVATAFIKGGFTRDELVQGWQKQGATIGMREYYSIIHWDADMPNRVRAGDIGFFKYTIPHYYNSGARYMTAEASDNWGPGGLGYYITSRLLWDVSDADLVDDLVEDFLEKSFGSAKEPMAEYYGLAYLRTAMSPKGPAPLNSDKMGRMYRALEKALASTDDPAIRTRINHLVLYTRYSSLYTAFAATKDADEKLKIFESIIRHSYRIRNTHMVHSLAQYRTLLRTYKLSQIPKEAWWQQPEETNPWKSSEPFSDEEIRQFIQQGIEDHPLRPFEIVEFSKDLVPATPLKLEMREPVGFTDQAFDQDYYTWLPQGGGEVTMTIATGINKRKARGPGSVSLYKVDLEPAPEAPAAEALESVEIEPRSGYHTITLKSPHGGLHRIGIISKGIGSRVKWGSLPLVAESSHLANLRIEGTVYFYVPKGTKVVGIGANGRGQVLNSSGKVMLDLNDPETKAGSVALPVEPGEDGKVWKFQNALGSRLLLMTVPPYLARNPEELLLPREVVEADAPK